MDGLLMFAFQDWVPIGLLDAKIFVTSEENSFGLSRGKWFDGKVQSPSISLSPRIREGYKLMYILETVEYSNKDSLCSKDGYYTCLTKIFAQKFHKPDSNWREICTPFTLPFDKKLQPIEYCTNITERAYFEALFFG